MKILAAAHVVPISSPPLADGAVAVEDGRIVAVSAKSDLIAKFPSAELNDLGNAAIIPGLVNCHSHLEITAMRGMLDDVEHDFRAWLLRLNSIREKWSADDVEASALAGAREGMMAGVTCFGDVGRMGHAGIAALKQTGLRGVVFQETEFSPDNRTANDDFQALGAKFEALKSEETELVKIGLSPHSPYTVSSQLFELIAQYAILNRIPLSIHAAESDSEIELLGQGTGFFTGVYEKFGFEWESPHSTPIEYLERLGVLAARPLLVHCVRVSESDISRIAKYGARVAHCPKSNAKFGHGLAPFEQLQDAGIAVGLGSDSVASNNVCDMLEESRFAAFAARNREGSNGFVSAQEVLTAATLGGARALGLDTVVGTLEPGKFADIAVVSLEHPAIRPVTDIYAALVFSANARDVIRTIVAGREIYARG